MKKCLMTIAGATAVFLAMAQITPATPVTGGIGFSGTVQVDAIYINGASTVINWAETAVDTTNGSFASVDVGTSVAMSTNWWSFNSGPLTNFWSAGGFTFDLTSSSVVFDSGGFLNIVFTGTLSGNGFDPTACAGAFQAADPSADGGTTFTEILNFAAVPPPPNLNIASCDLGSLQITWPGIGSYALEQNCDLTTTNWVAAGFAITNGFGTNFCTVTAGTRNLFFRLKQ